MQRSAAREKPAHCSFEHIALLSVLELLQLRIARPQLSPQLLVASAQLVELGVEARRGIGQGVRLQWSSAMQAMSLASVGLAYQMRDM